MLAAASRRPSTTCSSTRPPGVKLAADAKIQRWRCNMAGDARSLWLSITLLGANMSFQEFARLHIPALEADEIRFNLQIAVMAAAAKDFPAGFQYWVLGAPGHCATQTPRHPILLGDLDRGECQPLARDTKSFPYPGVLGSGSTACWFAEEAATLGRTIDIKV